MANRWGRSGNRQILFSWAPESLWMVIAAMKLKDAYSLGFPHSSVGKESACNAGNPGSIPGTGRSPGEGKGYPLQYSGLENSMVYSPWGCKESATTGRLSLSLF